MVTHKDRITLELGIFNLHWGSLEQTDIADHIFVEGLLQLLDTLCK